MASAEARTAQVLEDFAACVPTKRQRETAKRRELGLCLSCGKPSAPKATCAECGRKANEARKRRKARQ